MRGVVRDGQGWVVWVWYGMVGFGGWGEKGLARGEKEVSKQKCRLAYSCL